MNQVRAIGIGERQVDNRQIRLQGFKFIHGFGSGGCRSDDGYIVLGREQGFQTIVNDRMVVDD
ncbi:MAG: hypothetical protein K9M54_08285 [Kiritimatiellales bacterium]|nr:hypothetical protein [Kiritimatiellales bacterium]